LFIFSGLDFDVLSRLEMKRLFGSEVETNGTPLKKFAHSPTFLTVISQSFGIAIK
jgi:hypothetical protein